MDVRFVVAGSDTPALTTGFGAVFSDVDRPHSASMAYYDAAGRLLDRVKVPHSRRGGLAFAGLVFDEPVVARVRITAGTQPVDAAGADRSVRGRADLVVLDDFLYGEPHAAP
jgi:hypothetical protein